MLILPARTSSSQARSQPNQGQSRGVERRGRVALTWARLPAWGTAGGSPTGRLVSLSGLSGDQLANQGGLAERCSRDSVHTFHAEWR